MDCNRAAFQELGKTKNILTGLRSSHSFAVETTLRNYNARPTGRQQYNIPGVLLQALKPYRLNTGVNICEFDIE